MNHDSSIRSYVCGQNRSFFTTHSAGGLRLKGTGVPMVVASILAAALLVALAVLGYQNSITIPGLRKAQILSSAPPMLRAARAARETRGQSQSDEPASILVTVSRDSPVQVAFDIPPADYDSYSVEVFAESGPRKFFSVVPAGEAKDTVQILFPVGSLVPGRYHVVIQGIPAADSNARVPVAKYSFEVRFR